MPWYDNFISKLYQDITRAYIIWLSNLTILSVSDVIPETRRAQ